MVKIQKLIQHQHPKKIRRFNSLVTGQPSNYGAKINSIITLLTLIQQ